MVRKFKIRKRSSALGTLLMIGGVLTLAPVGVRAQSATTQSATQQMIDVSGYVVDEYNNKIPGATITTSDDKKVISNTDGFFTVKVPKGDKIRVSFITMIPQEVTITSNKELKIRLQPYDINIGEVVVTGYGQTTTRRTTGSVAVVDGDKLKDQPLFSVDKLLQGKVAGLSVKSVSGRPGQAAEIRIRGTNTITGNAEPLWVVDGVPMQKDIPKLSSSQVKNGDFASIFSGGISGINPNDIESVTVLKDASATAIYGSRAAGGVIVVTTKRGKAGRMQVNYSNYFSVNTKPQRMMNLMNSTEKIEWEEELWNRFSKKGHDENSPFPVIGLVGMVRSGKLDYAGLSLAQQNAILNEAKEHSTDWFDELFQNSFSQNHYLSLSGGNERNRYFISTGYGNNNGLVKKTSHDRYNLSAKIDITPNDRLAIGLNTDLSAQTAKSPSNTGDMFRYAYFANPYESPYNADGSYRADRTYYNLKEYNGGGFDTYTPPNGYNILREVNETSTVDNNYSGQVTGNLRYKILDKLSFSGIGSFSFTHNQADGINGRNTASAFRDRLYFDSYPSKRTYGSILQNSSNNSSYMLRGQVELGNVLKGKHYLSALAGSEIRSQRTKSVFTKRYGYDEVTGNASMPVPPKPTGVDYIDYNNLISYAAMVDGLSGQVRNEDAFASFYVSADYNYNRRYTLSLTGRTDGSNNFGSNQQFNPTWSAGLSWNVDEEDFFASIKPIMSRFTLRAATGFTGNVNKQVSPNLIMDYLSTFRKTDDDFYRMGWISNAPNKNLRWEKTKDYKIAADMGFLKNRITAQVEYYHRNSIDLVTDLRITSSTGFTQQKFNTSSVTNSGIELTLGGVIINKPDFTWGISGNMAYNQNKLTKFNTSSGAISVTSSNQIGYPLSSIFAGKVIGIDPETGIYKYALRPDVSIQSSADLRDANNYVYYLGTSNAPYTGGFSTSMRYKEWSLSIGGNYSFGGKIIDEINPATNYSSISKEGGGAREPLPTSFNDLYLNHLNVANDRSNVWTTDNPIVDGYPRIIDYFGAPLGLSITNPTSSTITRASMLANVSYVRIGSMHIGYNLKESVLKKIKLSSVGVNFSMSNLFTITNYKGIDPETPGAVYPLTRSFSMGLNIGF